MRSQRVPGKREVLIPSVMALREMANLVDGVAVIKESVA